MGFFHLISYRITRIFDRDNRRSHFQREQIKINQRCKRCDSKYDINKNFKMIPFRQEYGLNIKFSGKTRNVKIVTENFPFSIFFYRA